MEALTPIYSFETDRQDSAVMPVRRWSKRSKRRSSAQSLVTPQDDGVHVYLFWSPNKERYLSHTAAERVTAEELCISAAEAVGITPLFHVLFALYDPMSCCWYSPNHVFHPNEGSCLILHFRMRFYFRNWHAFNDKEPDVARFTVKSETHADDDGQPVLEIKSVEYLFAQAKYDFVNELFPMEKLNSEEELSLFKNESLGMAMLHLMHLALQTGSTLQRVAKKTSFINCIPKSYAKHISEDKVLTKMRLRWMFERSMRTYQNNMEAKKPDVKEIICKYIYALECLAPRFGSETFAVRHLRLGGDDEHTSPDASRDGGAETVHELMVSANTGLQWREMMASEVCHIVGGNVDTSCFFLTIPLLLVNLRAGHITVACLSSFINCIPKSYAKHISEDKVLTKMRLRWMFERSMRTYQNNMEAKKPDVKEIICKYIYALECLAPRFGSETFAVRHLRLGGDDEHTSPDASRDGGAETVHELMVSANTGLQWREMMASEEAKSNQWTPFCDFPGIIHIAISEANVCISTQDNKCMEVEMSSSQEARSFISLLDGYYRLTVDAHHYLCHEVAPPRVLLSQANGLHGPIHDDFVLHKLKKEEAEEEACLVRWSVLNYHRLVLAVPNKNQQNGSMASHKLFCIQHKDSVFTLDGWQEKFSSVKELTNTLKDYILKSGTDSYTIKKCCRPRQGELSNLLVKRRGIDGSASTRTLSPNKLELCFQIKYKDLILGQHLGFGTRTHIYSAHLQVGQVVAEQEDDLNGDKYKKIQVVLKVLEQSHEDITSAFFEMASLMSQVSHNHLVFVHGLSVNGSENIMVEEFVEFGPLDVFLCREKAKLTPRWKFIVAKQLANALNYLATKGVTHGNVCGRNVLVARRGLEQGTSPLVKLSDPGIAVNILCQEERLERIPWIAPECVYSKAPVGIGADQWSFGVTLLEICNDGHLPMSDATLPEKERFYQQKGKLLEPSSRDLAVFINKCLSYEPLERPHFCSLLRDLIDIMIKNPDISPSETLPQAHSTVFLKRHLKKKNILGKGNFGMVTLYMYDPANDGTGELVAVKSLKQENGPLPKYWLKEIETLKFFDHTNIVKYKGCCTEMGGQVVQLIMEFLPFGSLEKYLQKQEKSTSQCLLFAQQICQGMEYLHSKRYIHRDLAARNILVKNDSLVKIADFGLSKYIPENDTYYRVSEDGDSPVFWYALECLKLNKFSFRSDVWSFGVTLYEILTRCDPSQSPPVKFGKMAGLSPREMNVNVLISLLERWQRLPCPADCPSELRSLTLQCWDQDPAERPSFHSLFEQLEAIRSQPSVDFFRSGLQSTCLSTT
ncbi:non-receptor tyrosine-protein kinase TYK2 [Hippocampus comes]|uniref:non-receptor tyrosine-protein kinase TYK2 n=1 Tax=Hippocampus comes TaxID=109280 RepID=UPI00094E1C6F|nr:PREDICTED: non-receptor tyrosine-protein kinase TYK2-like [Hippocampus comes]